MYKNTTDWIQKNIPPSITDHAPEDEPRKKSNIQLFVENLEKSSGKTIEDLFPKIIQGFLENAFEVDCSELRYKPNNVRESKSGFILIETDPMFRMMHQLETVVALADQMLTPRKRFDGMAAVYDLFKGRSLFRFLSFHEADVYETTFLIQVVRKFIIGDDLLDFNDLCRFFPLSRTALMMDIVLKKDGFFFTENLIDCVVVGDNDIRINGNKTLLSLILS
ncbi:MAG: hypothetical protein ACKO5C_05120 [Ferruginibacter sp.]